MNITELVTQAYEIAKSKGFHDKGATFGDRIALVHSEVSEALEAFRDLDATSFDAIREPIYSREGKLTREPTCYVLTRPAPDLPLESTVVHNKPEGVRSELADVVIRVADMCGLYGIDLDAAIQEKLAYNKTRPYRHGGKQL